MISTDSGVERDAGTPPGSERPTGARFAPWVVVSLGVGVAGAAVYNFARELDAFGLAWPPAVAFLLSGGLAACVIYAGWRLATRERRAVERARIAGWCVGGALLLVGLTIATIAIRIAEGRPVGEPLIGLLVNASAGALAGFFIGIRTRTIRERERELERENDRLDSFASTVSHDLRNPLNVAQSRLELARDECDSEHLDATERAHDRLEQIIENLLTLARSGDATVTDADSVALGDIAEESWTTVDTADATIVIEAEATIRADETRLRRLFENLFRNAIEHGSEEVTVTVGELSDGFYVADDGPGVPAAERGDVFEPGYSTGEDGTGFGLAIVEEIARAHGWSARVTDSADGGARFEFTGVDRV